MQVLWGGVLFMCCVKWRCEGGEDGCKSVWEGVVWGV